MTMRSLISHSGDDDLIFLTSVSAPKALHQLLFKMDECAYSKKRADDRKKWLIDYDTANFRDHSEDSITYSDFINKDLILFSRADLQRSIPSMVDGLKAGQRKILFCAFKRKLKSDVKVAQLAGYVSEHSAYHHGEQSLASTIVGLAQNYVGSNNVNLLAPSGQFGTRLQVCELRWFFFSLSLSREIADQLYSYSIREYLRAVKTAHLAVTSIRECFQSRESFFLRPMTLY